MALATFTSSDGASIRVEPTAVVALEELSASATKIFLSSGKTFVVNAAIASTISTLGL